jgi:hypothetical protein
VRCCRPELWRWPQLRLQQQLWLQQVRSWLRWLWSIEHLWWPRLWLQQGLRLQHGLQHVREVLRLQQWLQQRLQQQLRLQQGLRRLRWLPQELRLRRLLAVQSPVQLP